MSLWIRSRWETFKNTWRCYRSLYLEDSSRYFMKEEDVDAGASVANELGD